MSQNSERYNNSLSKVFSPGLLTKLSDVSFENDLKELLDEMGLLSNLEGINFLDAISTAYNHLKENYRCEYIYKNEIANQLLLRYHADNSATLLNEFGINQSVADLVIVNGQTVAYEIKTELDNFDRLEGQLKNYSLIFDNIYVVTHSGALRSLMNKIEDSVGIILFDKFGNLVKERPAADNSGKFDCSIAANTLRQSELTMVYKKYEGDLPQIGTGYIGTFCRNWFSGLDKETAHFMFSECLKSRKLSENQFKLVVNSPMELKMLLLGKEMNNKRCDVISKHFDIFV
ncbi:MAG: sce7726 family protein [Chitinophagaceae bacterium]